MVAGILIVSDVPFRLLALAGTGAVVLGAAAIYMEPYRRARLLASSLRGRIPQGDGFQPIQAIIGSGRVGIPRRARARACSKMFYLPEPHTDFVFAIVGEELGFIGCDDGDRRVRRSSHGPASGSALVPRPVRKAPCRRDHDARVRPGGCQSLRGARDRPADGDSAAVRLLWRLVADRAPHRRRQFSLTSQSMNASSKPVVVIAAGGTAGHIRPALAVGEALRARGATVTFAGSPDRVESRLVPESGFELDTFAISGFPRSPSIALLRSLWQAGKAPFACRAILQRRRPDVVLGGGGYVAGPMVLAGPLVRYSGRPHRGGRAPRPRQPAGGAVRLEALPGLRHPRSEWCQGRGRRAADPDRASRVDACRSAGAPRPRRYGPHSRGVRGARRRRLAQRDGRECLGDEGPAVVHVSGDRDFAALRPRVRRPDYLLLAQTESFGDVLAAADIAVSRAGGTVWELAAAGTPAILVPYPHATADHQTLNARHFERGGGALVVPNEEIAIVPALVDGLPLADRGRLAAMGVAMRSMARVDASGPDRRRADRACPAMRRRRERRDAPGRPAPVLRRYRRVGHVRVCKYRQTARRRGARVGPPRHDLHKPLDAVDVDLGGEPSPPAGWETIVSTAHRHRVDGVPRAAFLAEPSPPSPRSSSGGPTARRRQPR